MRRIETPAARATDPDTSHEAANEVTATGLRAEQQARTLAAVRAFPGRTMQELSELTGLDRYMLGRRISECETSGVVFRGLKRRCSVTGRMAEPWFAVSGQGRAAA
ncbi:MarR family transcriptional regulator [Dyella halodurans]